MQILRDFPDEMRGDIAVHLHREVLALPLFNGASSQGFLKAVAMNIEPLFCAPGEYIIHTADVIHAIYYVGSGSLEVLKDSMVVAILGLCLLLTKTYRHQWPISRTSAGSRGATPPPVRALAPCGPSL